MRRAFLVASVLLLTLLFVPSVAADDFARRHLVAFTLDLAGPLSLEDATVEHASDCDRGEIEIASAGDRFTFRDGPDEEQCASLVVPYTTGFQATMMNVSFYATRDYDESRFIRGINAVRMDRFDQHIVYPGTTSYNAYFADDAEPQRVPEHIADSGYGHPAYERDSVNIRWAFGTVGMNTYSSEISHPWTGFRGAQVPLAHPPTTERPHQKDPSTATNLTIPVYIGAHFFAEARSLTEVEIVTLPNATLDRLVAPDGTVVTADGFDSFRPDGGNRTHRVRGDVFTTWGPGEYRVELHVPYATETDGGPGPQPAPHDAANTTSDRSATNGTVDTTAGETTDGSDPQTNDSDGSTADPGLSLWPVFGGTTLSIVLVVLLVVGVLATRRRRETAAAETDAAAGADIMAYLDAVVHDLKTPLIALDWLTKDMSEEIENADKATLDETAGRIRSNVDNMERMVADLLAISRLEREEDDPTPVALVPLVRQVVADHEEVAAQASSRIKVEAKTFPTIQADEARIRQAVGNLVSNALKYGKADGGRVLVRVESITRRGRPKAFRIEVWDDGPGVPAVHREKIFGMFERNPDETRSIGGTGLGLALVRRVAEHYEGRAWVEDAPGGGARFVLELDADAVSPHTFSEPSTPAA